MTQSKFDKVTPLPVRDAIEIALDALDSDHGAIFEPDILAQLSRVRKDSPARWARIRASVKAKGASVSELDRLTGPKQLAETRREIFRTVEPWPSPVDGDALLDRIHALIAAHVIADPETYVAAALWAAHTWFFDSFTLSPMARITAPEPRCGKTIMLEALGMLVRRPIPMSNVSAAALFRCVELWEPTLLIDEADTFLRDNEEVRGIINGGLYRKEANVLRTVGDEHKPTLFSTWCPKALCGIGKLAQTIEDRSIPLRLRRKRPDESIAKIRRSDPLVWEEIQSKLLRLALDNADRVEAIIPDEIRGLNDRANDCWEPLRIVAEIAGGEWPQRAIAAAKALHVSEHEEPTAGNELLADIKTVYENRSAKRLATSELLDSLVKLPGGRWAAWNHGRELSSWQLSRLLKEYGIRSSTKRFGDVTMKGYDKAQFEDAFARYLVRHDE